VGGLAIAVALVARKLPRHDVLNLESLSWLDALAAQVAEPSMKNEETFALAG
jgi:hypothetical protein